MSETKSNDASEASSIAGQKIHVGHFVTGRDDATLNNVSVLSKPAEWHAVMVGILAAVAPTLLTAVGLGPDVAAALGPGFALSYVGGRLTKDVAKNVEDVLQPQHIRDALAEPAYTAAGYVLAHGLEVVAAVV